MFAIQTAVYESVNVRLPGKAIQYFKLKLQEEINRRVFVHPLRDIMPKPHQLWTSHLFTANTCVQSPLISL